MTWKRQKGKRRVKAELNSRSRMAANDGDQHCQICPYGARKQSAESALPCGAWRVWLVRRRVMIRSPSTPRCLTNRECSTPASSHLPTALSHHFSRLSLLFAPSSLCSLPTSPYKQ